MYEDDEGYNSDESVTSLSSVASAASVKSGEYNKTEFELGDLGLPDDGYDYSKHLKPIDETNFVAAPVCALALVRSVWCDSR